MKQHLMITKKHVHLDQFNGVRSYNAALLAIDLANQVMMSANEGHLIVEDGELIDPSYTIDVSDGSFSLYIRLGPNARAWVVGCERDERGKSYITKKMVRAHFSNLKIYKVMDITGVLK